MKVIFLDRDGVINIDSGYVHKKEDWIFTYKCLDALKSFIDKGFKLIIVTNQAGIAKGLYSVEDYNALTKWYLNIFKENGIPVLSVLDCPHHPQGIVVKYKKDCNCRKPKPGLIKNAVSKFKIDIQKSILVGDKISDIIAGTRGGMKNLVIVDSGYFTKKDLFKLEIVPAFYKNLYEFSSKLKS
jgi:D-glycero-D-manno-heptose 1,7-bisphosphate phosphatase